NPLLYQLSYPGIGPARAGAASIEEAIGEVQRGERGVLGASVLGRVVVWRRLVVLRRRDRIAACQPSLQVDVGAAARAERAVLGDGGLAADRTGAHAAPTPRRSGGRPGSARISNRAPPFAASAGASCWAAAATDGCAVAARRAPGWAAASAARRRI